MVPLPLPLVLPFPYGTKPIRLSSVAKDISLHFVFEFCRDVTDVFEAFHRDPRHRRKLEAFRVGTLVGYEPSSLVKDFRALKEEITAEGLFEVYE